MRYIDIYALKYFQRNVSNLNNMFGWTFITILMKEGHVMRISNKN